MTKICLLLLPTLLTMISKKIAKEESKHNDPVTYNILNTHTYSTIDKCNNFLPNTP